MDPDEVITWVLVPMFLTQYRVEIPIECIHTYVYLNN